MKLEPSKEKLKVWIRTERQITEAEKKQRQFDVRKVNKFLERKGYKNFRYFKYENDDILKRDKNATVIKFAGGYGVITPGKKLSAEVIDELAKHVGLISGKWLIYAERKNVDRVWRRIKKLWKKKKIWSAKVSTATEPPQKPHVICVYTKDYLDEKDVMKVLEELRDIGIEDRLTYKPDIYTMLGIYYDTKDLFGLPKASRYAS